MSGILTLASNATKTTEEESKEDYTCTSCFRHENDSSDSNGENVSVDYGREFGDEAVDEKAKEKLEMYCENVLELLRFVSNNQQKEQFIKKFISGLIQQKSINENEGAELNKKILKKIQHEYTLEEVEEFENSFFHLKRTIDFEKALFSLFISKLFDKDFYKKTLYLKSPKEMFNIIYSRMFLAEKPVHLFAVKNSQFKRVCFQVCALCLIMKIYHDKDLKIIKALENLSDLLEYLKDRKKSSNLKDGNSLNDIADGIPNIDYQAILSFCTCIYEFLDGKIGNSENIFDKINAKSFLKFFSIHSSPETTSIFSFLVDRLSLLKNAEKNQEEKREFLSSMFFEKKVKQDHIKAFEEHIIGGEKTLSCLESFIYGILYIALSETKEKNSNQKVEQPINTKANALREAARSFVEKLKEEYSNGATSEKEYSNPKYKINKI